MPSKSTSKLTYHEKQKARLEERVYKCAYLFAVVVGETDAGRQKIYNRLTSDTCFDSLRHYGKPAITKALDHINVKRLESLFGTSQITTTVSDPVHGTL